MLARLLLVLASAAWMAGCTATPPPAPASAGTPLAAAVVLRTWAPPSPVACPEARTEGILVREPQSGAGLRDNQGAVSQVIWPTDYTARDDGGRLAVIDSGGNVIAHEGDHVEIGGQDVGGGTWLGCGGMRLITP